MIILGFCCGVVAVFPGGSLGLGEWLLFAASAGAPFSPAGFPDRLRLLFLGIIRRLKNIRRGHESERLAGIISG